VEQAISLSMPKWKSDALAAGLTIRINQDFSKIPLVPGDAAELREALINLIFNAVDAMPSGGEITLRTSAHTDAVWLEVQDTGIGMSEEVRQRCLEPYFTTKGMRGTGLGLSMVYAIIHRHAGLVEIESELGRGTTFILKLPFVANFVQSQIPKRTNFIRPLRILVVDDQPLLCNLLYECLSNDRHAVETACNGREGLEKFRAGRFDLVLTDKAMPEMDGDQLAAAIKQINPSQRIILITGYCEYSPGTRSDAIDLVVGKPVSMDALRQALSVVLAE
jgi:CheY-like chemotaxis protein/anti-sigma regulatory factor (Ser/Thr protein kinase)